MRTHGFDYGRHAHQMGGTSKRVRSNYLVCPTCFELLTRSDIEGFGHCPYCNHRFEFDADMEDFLLRPLIREWTRSSHIVQDE